MCPYQSHQFPHKHVDNIPAELTAKSAENVCFWVFVIEQNCSDYSSVLTKPPLREAVVRRDN
jgi:hypothetical protein